VKNTVARTAKILITGILLILLNRQLYEEDKDTTDTVRKRMVEQQEAMLQAKMLEIRLMIRMEK
jgi:hypothetical protein